MIFMMTVQQMSRKRLAEMQEQGMFQSFFSVK